MYTLKCLHRVGYVELKITKCSKNLEMVITSALQHASWICVESQLYRKYCSLLVWASMFALNDIAVGLAV